MLDQISSLKNQLEFLEKEIGESLVNTEKREVLFHAYEEKVQEIRNTKEEDIININVGGKHFATKYDTLMSVPDNLFHKIVMSKKFDIRKGIFIDRSPTLFPHILEYFRTKKINYKKFTTDELIELREEAIYYELLEIERDLDANVAIGKYSYVKMEVSAWYNDSTGLVGSTDVKVLLDKNLNTGVCTNSPGWIILEINSKRSIEEVEVAGYIGNSAWVNNDGWGVNAQIQTSEDKKSWNTVGNIPSGFGQTVKTVTLTKSTAKYIRIYHNSWIGLGYFNITK